MQKKQCGIGDINTLRCLNLCKFLNLYSRVHIFMVNLTKNVHVPGTNTFKMAKKTLNLLSIFDQKNETLKCLKKKVLGESQMLNCGMLIVGCLLY